MRARKSTHMQEVAHDVVIWVMVLLILDVMILLLRNVNDILILQYVVKSNLLPPGVLRA